MNIKWVDKCVTIRSFQEKLLEHDMLHSCVNCENFNFKTDTCDKFKMKPPTDIIVFSCGPDWTGGIPF